MLDVKNLRSNIDEISSLLLKKGYSLDKDLFFKLVDKKREIDIKSQDLLSKRNQASKNIGQLIQQGHSVETAKSMVSSELEEIDESLQGVKSLSLSIDSELNDFLYDIPNIPHQDVPCGNDESSNVEISRWGNIRNFNFPIKDHVYLGENLNGMDLEAASLITGSRFSILKGSIALLHRALSQFMLDQHILNHGYLEINPPLVVNKSSLVGTGQLPKFEEDLFKLKTDSDYYLIPTAEVPLTNLVRDKILDNKELPLKLVAHTACFRSEAGSYGRDTRGLIRQHQFEKIELVQIVTPDMSDSALESLTSDAEKILKLLNLPYRKVILCGGDLSFGSHKTYDLEVWMPSQNCYREISSCSNFSSFQARRMKTRYRDSSKSKSTFVHTINGSGLAVGRALVAVLENFQDSDGNIEIPEVLRPYMHNQEYLYKT